MTFFNSISNERKNQILSGRISSLKEELWITLIDAELTPENLNMDNFDPNTAISEAYAHVRSRVTSVMNEISKAEEIKSGLSA
tara:strand:- start:252 stop:500 length:249 start_codon:yes stop_codon:yes gene_type:complete